MTCPPNPGIRALALLLSLLAAFSALLLARRRASHRPVAWALCGIFAADAIRTAISYVLPCAGPFSSGAMRALFHVDQALFLTWPAWLVWVTCRVLEPPNVERWRPGFARVIRNLYTCAVVIVVGVYPDVRGDGLRTCYLAIELIALLICAGTILRAGPSQLERGASVAVVWLLVGVDLALLFCGAWRYGLFGDAYALTQAGLSVMYAALVGVQVFALASGSRCEA